MNDDHRAIQLAEIRLQDIEGDVVRIAAFGAREIAKALTRVLRKLWMIEQHHALPAAARDDALVLAHAPPALARAEVMREIVLRPERHDGVEERGAIEPRMHVERDVEAPARRLVDQLER